MENMPEIKIRTETYNFHDREVRDIARDTLSPFQSFGDFSLACEIHLEDDDGEDGCGLGQTTYVYRNFENGIEFSRLDDMQNVDKMRLGGPSFVILSREDVVNVTRAAFGEMREGDTKDGLVMAFNEGLVIMSDASWHDIIDAISEGGDIETAADTAIRILLPTDISAHTRLDFVTDACAMIETMLRSEAKARVGKNERMKMLLDIKVSPA